MPTSSTLILALTLSLTALRTTETLPAEAESRFADLALACAHKEYPNKIAHVMDSDGDAQPPRKLTPAFFGCYDWHSAVHGHWLLVRLTRLHPEAPFAPRARDALAKSLTAENLAVEAAYLARTGRETFERPYGLAWLLALGQELREWDDPQARTWAARWRRSSARPWHGSRTGFPSSPTRSVRASTTRPRSPSG